MKKSYPVFKKIYCALVFLFAINTVNAQWTNDPAANTPIISAPNGQAVTRLASLSDGGTYVAWFDNRSGNYDMYLQHLDQLGNKMWADSGLVISSNPQQSYVTGYSLICDQNDNAVIIFNDVRDAGQIQLFGYKISPTGQFLWGANGIQLSTGTGYFADGYVAETTDGSFVFNWFNASPAGNNIAMQKVSADGNLMWGSDPVIIDSVGGQFFSQRIVASDNGSVLISYKVKNGNYAPYNIYVSKYSADSSKVWGTIIQDLGNVNMHMHPTMISDNNDGAIIAWTDDRDLDMKQKVYVQRVKSDGTIAFPENGVEGPASTTNRSNLPTVVFDNASQSTYMYWVEVGGNQDQWGINGQKYDAAGAKQWGADGHVFKALSQPQMESLSNLTAKISNNVSKVFYFESTAAGGLDPNIFGFAADADANFVWDNDIITVSEAIPGGDRMQMAVTQDGNGVCKLVWGDKRNDATTGEDLYGQNVNADGTLGNPIVPVELTSFTSEITDGNVVLKWQTATETNNKGFKVYRGDVELGFVAGIGTTSKQHNYNFIDKDLAIGDYNYKLEQIDFDGTSKFVGNIVASVNTVPNEYGLTQNYPNPFNPSTTISYSIRETGVVKLVVFNSLGQQVAQLVNTNKEAGSYNVSFNANNLTSGIYFYSISVNDFVSTKKMMLLK